MNEASIQLFNGFALDLARGCLEHSGQPVHLRRQSYEVLKYLVENQGYLISKDKLIEDVWEGRAVTDSSLSKCIEEVREALGTDARHYIRNVRGRGYIFDPGKPENGQTRSALTDDELIAESSENKGRLLEKQGLSHVRASEPHSAPNLLVALSSHRTAVLLFLGAIAIPVAALVYLKYSAPPGGRITSLAVLPFTNATGDANVDYLSDGLTESLIDRLAQLGEVKVIARSSSFKYKGEQVDPPEVAHTLGVQAIVTGKVALRGDSLVVTAELVNANDRTQLWGEKYVRNPADVQAVQEEIARTISDKLRVHLSGLQQQRLTKHATDNAQAFEFYLNGQFCLGKGGRDNLRTALDYFNRALALDNDFALAWVGVARAHSFFAGNSLRDPRIELVQSKAAALKALELDNTLAEAHSELARLKQDEWD